MTTEAPPPLDLLSVPLHGIQVIEASAGTGKTHTITRLFLRLVLEAGIEVDRILVVTYTVAATEELRERIRALLGMALAALRGDDEGDPLVAELAARVSDRAEATRRVQHALWNFDRAGIHTIHGFCQRVLVENAFESRLPFECEILPDVSELLQEVVDDFWREHLVEAPVPFVQCLLERRVSPERLAASVAPHLGRPDLRLIAPDAVADEAARYDAWRAAWDALRAQWPAARPAVEALLLDPGLNRSRYPLDSVPTWLRRMDGYLRADLPGLKTFDKLPKLAADEVARSWKKGVTPRTHPALDACEAFVRAHERVVEAVEVRLKRLKVELLLAARGELEVRKGRARLRSYDDLLQGVRRALESAGGAALAERLRENWAAALVDEFQDTDPTQYEIVRRIWDGASQPVFLVGDPKQAIYRFRGADVFAYLAARAHAESTHVLDVNWRSDPGLVAAVNAIFGQVDRPFVLEAIPFLAARPAATQREVLTIEGEPREPFRVWFFDRGGAATLVPKGDATRAAATATAAEIANLLRLADAHRARLGDRDLEGSDIAVLVRSHRQGRLMGDALAGLGVPSVQQAEDSVFASPEAEQLRRVLLAVAEPGRDDIVRAALGTELLGMPGEELVRLLAADAEWAARIETFHGYHRLWREHGFARMFRALAAAAAIAPRLLALADGERRLTNLLHLGELLADEAARQPRGLEALSEWMATRAADPHPESEEQQLRLESDEHVVKIVTIHKSKGLQYPIVFCPFLWDGRLFAERDRDVACHDEAHDDRATLEMEADGQSPLRVQACREELAESLRLLYVALTRAEHRCTVVWGPGNDSPTSPLFWLLYGAEAGNQIGALRARVRGLDDAALRRGVDDLAERGGGSIRVDMLPAGRGQRLRSRATDAESLAARTLVRPVPAGWGLASFSALASTRSAEGPDHDADVAVAPTDEEPAERNGFTFPSGARAGSCLHAILERLDFTDAAPERRRLVIARELRRFGFSSDWQPAVEAMVGRVLGTALDDAGRIRLADVPRERRLDELEFTYPLTRFDVAGLGALLREHAFTDGPLGDVLGTLEFAPVKGFMRGFIDIVFEADGRYWLADYKSNWLGPTLNDYAGDRLPAVIARETYWLQYLIYTVVLHRLLRLRLPHYDYDQHVGGVLYLFLRGMDPVRGAACGVFRDRLARALVEGLDRWLGELP